MNMTINPVEWAIDRLLDHYPNLHQLVALNHPEMTPREWLRGRINWGIQREFTWFDGDQYGPTGVLMLRPVNQELLESICQNYWAHVFDYDPAGAICFVDFAYGPGLYHKFIRLCKKTERQWISYGHKEKLHMVILADMPD